MNAVECHALVDANYKDPVFVGYEPIKYDVERATTPKRKEKLQKKIDAENMKLKIKFDREVTDKKSVHDEIDEVAKYPTEIAELFLSTFEWTISDIVRRHEAYLKFKEELKKKYAEEVFNHITELKYLIEKRTWQGRGYHTIYVVDVSDEDWEKWTSYYYREHFRSPEFKDPNTRRQLLIDCKDLLILKENDDISCEGANAYVNAILHTSDTLKRIRKDIDAIMHGMPEKCETLPGWGVDGRFNGILVGNGKRISFCSFGAGGYNIQRYHFRYKITELK